MSLPEPPVVVKRNYGCCLCQERHYSGDPLFDAHLTHQSKHGFMHSDSYEPYRPAAVDSVEARIAYHEDCLEDAFTEAGQRYHRGKLAELHQNYDKHSEQESMERAAVGFIDYTTFLPQRDDEPTPDDWAEFGAYWEGRQ